MKKLLTILTVSVLGVCLFGSTQKADAQVVVFSNQCCDASNTIRCIQVNMTPIGSACYCNYQGWGHTC